MNVFEFTERLRPHVSKAELDALVESYEKVYEPVYMRLLNVDKDDYCAALRSETVRRIVGYYALTIDVLADRDKECARANTENRQLREENAKMAEALHGVMKAATKGLYA